MPSVRQNVITWLAEVGVPDADDFTLVSSLSLVWVLYRLEETAGVVVAGDTLQGDATDVVGLVKALERAVAGSP